MGAYQRSHDMETALGSVASILKSSVDDVVPALERIMERQRDFEKELPSLRQAQLSRFAEELHAQVSSDYSSRGWDGYPGEQLRTLAADLQRRGRRVVVLVGRSTTRCQLRWRVTNRWTPLPVSNSWHPWWRRRRRLRAPGVGRRS